MKLAEVTDATFGEFLKLATTAVREASMQRTILAAAVMACGGKVKIGQLDLVNAVDGNQTVEVERVGMDIVVRAYARPRCEKCGHWEEKTT